MISIASRKSPADTAFADDVDSKSERCGFVCHVMVVLIAFTYTAFILHANFISSSGPPRWTRVSPAIIACIFVAALVMYFVVNAFLSTNKLDALETIQDEFSSTAAVHAPNSTAPPPEDSISHIYDVDVAVINDLVWGKAQHGR